MEEPRALWLVRVVVLLLLSLRVTNAENLELCGQTRCGPGTFCETFSSGAVTCSCLSVQNFRDSDLVGDITFCVKFCSVANDPVCPEGTTCSIQQGSSRRCYCPSGYRRSTTTAQCIEIDECKEGSAFCSGSLQCVNTDGSYNCLPRDSIPPTTPPVITEPIVNSQPSVTREPIVNSQPSGSIATTAPPLAPQPTTSGGPNGGAIAGAVIGVLLALVIVAVLVFFLVKRRRRGDQSEAEKHDYVNMSKPGPETTTRSQSGTLNFVVNSNPNVQADVQKLSREESLHNYITLHAEESTGTDGKSMTLANPSVPATAGNQETTKSMKKHESAYYEEPMDSRNDYIDPYDNAPKDKAEDTTDHDYEKMYEEGRDYYNVMPTV